MRMFKNLKERLKTQKKRDNKKQHQPIVFMNSPIFDESSDVIGIDSSIQSIKKAIANDAKMIGVIADYGSGKSSLTETLIKNKKGFGKAIHINMWDSISRLETPVKEDDAINSLTKSFVFQLAAGVSEHCAKHVNRRLSKNYGILSFSISSWRFWLWAVLAAVSYVFYAGISLLEIEEIKQAFILLKDILHENLISAISVGIKAAAPLFMVLGIIFCVVGLRKTTVAFSQWQAQNPREPEINDLFESYLFIHNKLLSFFNNRLIIIEDLDRIDDKDLIVGFLKEIYRFSSISLSKLRKGPVFVVSVMPESQLKTQIKKNNPNPLCGNNNDIYSKLFDYTVSLKPIHFTDYAEIVLNIIGDEESKNRKQLQSVLEPKDKIIGEQLPKSFDWIITGHNLTIRQLKDRLNSAISLFITLKNKGYKNQSYISFSSCAAVTYLEHQYPDLFVELLKYEEDFSSLVRASYKFKRSSQNDIENEIDNHLSSEKIKNNKNYAKFRKDLSKMIKAREIFDDFRIYFYSFPKNSYIKNSDERDICNLLLLPDEYSGDKDLSEKISRIIKDNKDNTILEVLTQISNDNDTPYFPEIIFYNKYLFTRSYIINSQKTIESAYHFASWNKEDFERSKNILSSLISFFNKVPEEFWNSYSERLSVRFYSLEEEMRIKIRKQIISVVGKRIELFEGLFLEKESYDTKDIQPDFTIITEDELSLMPSKKIATLMINTKLIDENNFKYIIDHINSFKSNGIPNLFTKTLEIITSIAFNVDMSLCWKECIKFLKNNEYVDNELFTLIVSTISDTVEDKAIIGDYLSSLQSSNITEEYLKIVDKENIDVGLSQEMLNLLYENKLFSALLSFLSKKSSLNFVDFTVTENQPEIIVAIERILTYDASLVPLIRYELIRQFSHINNFSQMNEMYKDVFYENYPKITKEEIDIIPDITIILGLLNRTKVTTDNYREIVSAINKKSKPEQCMEIFDLLLNPNYNDPYTDNTIVISMLNNLDYQVVGVSNLNTEEMKTLTEFIGEYQDLSNSANAKSFMEKAECLFPELEKVVVGAKIEYYVELINRVDKPSEFTMNWLDENEVYFELPHNVLEKLLNQKSYQKYLVGKVLKEERFSFPYACIPNEIVVEEYTPQSPIWQYVQGNYSLVNFILKNKLYETFDKNDLPSILPFLYQGKQYIDFTEFVFAQVPEDEMLNYLKNMGEIADEKNSIAISKLLTQGSYIGLLEKDDVFETVKERLWEDVDSSFKGYKSSFTRKRNDYFRK